MGHLTSVLVIDILDRLQQDRGVSRPKASVHGRNIKRNGGWKTV